MVVLELRLGGGEEDAQSLSALSRLASGPLRRVQVGDGC